MIFRKKEAFRGVYVHWPIPPTRSGGDIGDVSWGENMKRGNDKNGEI